jgi:vacuolar-type H+-ATPase subunit F/Vma7
MARAAVIGADLRIQGYALAGAALYPVDGQAGARHAWQELPADIAVVIVTAEVARWLGDDLSSRAGVLPVVMPE